MKTPKTRPIQSLKLENNSEQVASLPTFFARMWRYALFCGALIAFSVGIGVLGYHFLSDLSYLDSFHMACMILTGMGPVAEMVTSEAKLFSAFYALYSGVAFLSIIAVFFAPIVHRLLHILHVTDDE